jgi:hypothetical protein
MCLPLIKIITAPSFPRANKSARCWWRNQRTNRNEDSLPSVLQCKLYRGPCNYRYSVANPDPHQIEKLDPDPQQNEQLEDLE